MSALLHYLANDRDTQSGLFPLLTSEMFDLDANDFVQLGTRTQSALDAPAKRDISRGMDFDDEHLQDVIRHVREVYGEDHVCKVITYSTIKAKQAINDANRVLGFPVYKGQKLSKMLSNDPRLALSNALHKNEGKEDQYSPDFEEAYKSDQDSRKIIDAALSIEGLTRGEGVHACATLIAPTPVTDHVPTKLDTKGNVTITQYEGHSVADMPCPGLRLRGNQGR